MGISRKTLNRFYSKFRFDPSTECWIWTAGKHDGVYGGFQFEVWTYAHRASWMIHKGPIPENLLVCHHCDNTLCVNPDHLFLGTDQDNTLDCMAKGRYVVMKGESNGCSKLTEKEVLEIRDLAKHLTHAELGRRYGVTGEAVSLIVHRKNWKHI